jgi:hypothetical protein
MARVTYGALVTDLAGSIAGTTFQKNSSGAIARARAYTPVNPSIQQSDRQLALIQLVAKWATLTTTQKGLWNALAAAHNKINNWGHYTKLSGYQWFISYNLNAFTQDQGPWLTPEAYVLVDPVPAFTLYADADEFLIDFGAPVPFPGTYAGIYATVPMRQTSIKLRKSTFLLTCWATTNTQYIDITALYEALFNISWADFYTSAECAIIVRMKNFQEDSGYASPFTSALIQLG